MYSEEKLHKMNKDEEIKYKLNILKSWLVYYAIFILVAVIYRLLDYDDMAQIYYMILNTIPVGVAIGIFAIKDIVSVNKRNCYVVEARCKAVRSYRILLLEYIDRDGGIVETTLHASFWLDAWGVRKGKKFNMILKEKKEKLKCIDVL